MAESESESVVAASMREKNSGALSVSSLILLIGAALQIVRICHVESNDGKLPFLSANDRSRWCTIESLCTTGSYEIDHFIFADEKQLKRTGWYSIDLVRHRGNDGLLHYYSSKPPLLPTLYAGVYCSVRACTGWNLTEQPFLVARSMLVLVNVVPLFAFFWFVLRWMQRSMFGVGSPKGAGWAMVVLACVLAFGTFLTTFANTLNNHLPAAISVGLSLWCLDQILIQRSQPYWLFVLCGLFTSFGAANELPALGWVAAAGAALLIANPAKMLLGYVPGLVPVVAAFFGLNYLAHGEWSPAYAHRDVGATIGEFEYTLDQEFLSTEWLVEQVETLGVDCSGQCQVRPARREGVYELLDIENQRQFALRVDVANERIVVHEWGDWYDYPRSYWAGEKQGVDRGEESQGWYAFHCLIGHHGVFSLTPFWLLSVVGIGIAFIQARSINFFRDHCLMLVLAILATSVVVIGFYLARGLEDRNYGGVTSGFRWSFWLIPLWLWLAGFSLSKARRPWVRTLVGLLVLLSVFSASYPWGNPWTTPWPMQLMELTGWL